MDLADIHDLLKHMEWADALVWQSVLSTPAAIASTEMHRRLHHVHTVQHAYLHIWRGEAMPRDLPAFQDFEAMGRWAATFYPAAALFAAQLNEPALRRHVHFPWADYLEERFGAVRPATLAQTFQQVAMHSTHHRGQVLMHLRELGAAPPLTDFVAWIWYGQPAAEWPAPLSTAKTEPR